MSKTNKKEWWCYYFDYSQYRYNLKRGCIECDVGGYPSCWVKSLMDVDSLIVTKEHDDIFIIWMKLAKNKLRRETEK
jgi:hypothetical protein